MREDEMRTLTDVSELRALYGQPMVLAVKKSLPRLDRHCRGFIRLSPFLLVSTQGPEGADISPRGDPSGFVSVEDDATILIPDRPGNNRVDTLENILHNPRVGIIFLVPGLTESLRINGMAEIVVGAELQRLAHGNRIPKTAIRVRIEEVFFHCAKALIRSRLWEPETRVPAGSLAPLGVILADQIAGVDAEAESAAIEEAYRTTLY
jgi:PPOX class probable FMN-dependent enzyme